MTFFCFRKWKWNSRSGSFDTIKDIQNCKKCLTRFKMKISRECLSRRSDKITV